MRTKAFLGATSIVLGLSLTACPKDNAEPVTTAEASQALEESTLSSQAQELTSSSIELSTNFTLGGAVEQAADQLRAFVASQLPCAGLTLTGNTLSVVYGKNPGNCTYHGHTFSGEHTITVVRAGSGDVEVDHAWKKLSDGVLEVSGTAQVTWSFSAASRHVVHSVSWTRISDGLTATGSGDETQKALTGGLIEGIQVDGTRAWDGKSGHWDLGVNGVQWRWVDPVPQSGSYTLAMPNKKSLTMTFSRVDDTHIKVVLTSGDKTFSFVVAKTGQITGS